MPHWWRLNAGSASNPTTIWLNERRPNCESKSSIEALRAAFAASKAILPVLFRSAHHRE